MQKYIYIYLQSYTQGVQIFFACPPVTQDNYFHINWARPGLELPFHIRGGGGAIINLYIAKLRMKCPTRSASTVVTYLTCILVLFYLNMSNVTKQTVHYIFLCTVFNTALSAALQIPLRRGMLGSDPGLLRLRHWQSDAQTTRLDLIHYGLEIAQ